MGFRIQPLRLLLALGVAALLGLSSLAAAETPSVGSVSIESAGHAEPRKFRVEIADEPGERNRGLMARPWLGDDVGMLFIYPEPQIASFWMKNTLIPLDMIFIDAEGIIESIEAMAEPHTLTPRMSKGAVKAVLEIRGGRAEELGLAPGDRVIWAID